MSDKDEKVEDTEETNDEDKKQIEEEKDNPDEMGAQRKLFYFAKRGEIENLKEVVKLSDINAVDNEGFKKNPYISRNTALHYAVQSGSLDCVKFIYDLEAKLDAKNKLNSTPLHIAASLGYTDIVEYLIEMKATIDAKNVLQNTPLHCAVYAGHVETVKAILSQLDEPRQALLEPNGVGMGAAKYTAHEEMKALLRTYFPKRNKNNDDQKEHEPKIPEEGNDIKNNDVEEEEVPSYNNNIENEDNTTTTTANPTVMDDEEEGGDNNINPGGNYEE